MSGVDALPRTARAGCGVPCAGDPAALLADASRARRDLGLRPARCELGPIVDDAVAPRVLGRGPEAGRPSDPCSPEGGAP